jgi:uncharacterized protein
MPLPDLGGDRVVGPRHGLQLRDATPTRFPFFDYPYVVVLVELAEGVRLVSNLCDIEPADVTVGMPVEVCYQTFDNDLVLHQFRPAASEGNR